jgi:hypothetical protein
MVAWKSGFDILDKGSRIKRLTVLLINVQNLTGREVQ